VFAYFDCFSGLSGDMILGALIDLGVPVEWLDTQLKRLPLTGFTLDVHSVYRHGIRGTKVTVKIQNDVPVRAFADIRRMLQESPLPPDVQGSSMKIFDRIAAAESFLHGCPKDQVHFHELGAVDALVDVVGACLGLDYLGLRKIVASRIPLGTGWIDCAHGRLPVPAPATLEILKGVPVHQTEIPRELTTPTGAAVIATLSEGFTRMPDMVVEKIGYGAGTRDLKEMPNLLRVVVGRPSPPLEGTAEHIVVAECAVDDMNPEIFGHLMERLFESGALDVYWIPVFMKKNRPGTLIQVLCKEKEREAVLRCLLSESTTLGVRFSEVPRWTLPREPVTVETIYGPLPAKRIREPDGKWRIVPEYETCRKIAKERGIPLRDVYSAVSAAGNGLAVPDAVSS